MKQFWYIEVKNINFISNFNNVYSSFYLKKGKKEKNMMNFCPFLSNFSLSTFVKFFCPLLSTFFVHFSIFDVKWTKVDKKLQEGKGQFWYIEVKKYQFYIQLNNVYSSFHLGVLILNSKITFFILNL